MLGRYHEIRGHGKKAQNGCRKKGTFSVCEKVCGIIPIELLFGDYMHLRVIG